MITPVFYGRVSRGSLQADSRFHSYLGSLEGLEIEIVVRKKRSKRSDQVNRYYWGVVVSMIADHCGYTKDECHDALKLKFLGSRPDENGLTKMRSTASLSKDEFSQYLNSVVQFAAISLSVFIPGPNDVEY